jgi:8-hydroxy-5-deazaflavin:NADPH oxidoreductase
VVWVFSCHLLSIERILEITRLVDGMVDGKPLDVFIGGDDAGAKAKVAKLIEAEGLRVVDAGPRVWARQLDVLGLLHIALQSQSNNAMRTAL